MLGIQKNENRECLQGLKGLREDKLVWVSTGTIFLQKPKKDVIVMIEKGMQISPVILEYLISSFDLMQYYLTFVNIFSNVL